MDQVLTNAEMAIMSLLWERQPLTARDIREQLYPDANKAQHGTVQKLLQRLEEKGFVVRDRSVAVHYFSARISREAYGSGQLESLADKLTSGSVAPFITHLIENRKITGEELSRIRALLDANREEEQDRD